MSQKCDINKVLLLAQLTHTRTVSLTVSAQKRIPHLYFILNEMDKSKCSPLTAMWQVDVPQITAMRAVIGRSSQGRLNPFTSAPRTPAKTKKKNLGDTNHNKLYFPEDKRFPGPAVSVKNNQE